MTKTLRGALLAGAALLASTGAQATTLVALTADNMLVRMDSETRRADAARRITGADGRVIAIDQRPANGRLYGVTERGQIVTLDPATGRATEVSRLNTPFESGGRAVADFNPVPDRLRLMGMNGTNFRVNVDTGEVARDGTLKHGEGPLSGTTPRIVAGAYINSVAGATTTTLYTLDTLQNALNVQAPPNDGVQAPRAPVSTPLPTGVAFDILTEGTNNTAFLMAGGALHTLNLADGVVSARGSVTGLPAAEVIDIAVLR
ncbi:DUF4394 domain-containing protein [Roseococcus sp. SDR]|uniref:DUF4394 domain-containing protein n=1 Tax=Roseococcus sp. SDR TaxID=2835532 RepID=UPI001BCFCB96|nr:DUF4394 domain-containing protein [Roseococcus sp. SDR]MBS7788835.1 DUF4394 domain-containing protein [Roseococcus sp. SDR]MBV1844149.1 DUF4394 domain-containing protein [Roseococcus sp. SDR]